MYNVIEEDRLCGGFGRFKDETRMVTCFVVGNGNTSIVLRNKRLAEAAMSALNKGEVYLSKESSKKCGIEVRENAKFIMGKYAAQDLRALGYKI